MKLDAFKETKRIESGEDKKGGYWKFELSKFVFGDSLDDIYELNAYDV